MRVRNYPSSPGAPFEDFLRKSEQIKDERLAAAIPREYFSPQVWRGVLGLAVSGALYIAAIAGLAVSRSWLLYLPLLIVASLGGWGLHCIAHDCGHGSFSRSRRLNFIVGHLTLLPLVYPFHAWRHVHNMHHTHANNLDLETDWRPIPADAFDRMPLLGKVLYRGARSWAYWGGTINYWRVSAFRPSFFPRTEMQREVRRSIWVVAVASAIYFPALIYFTGIRGLLLCFVAPWIAIHVWFSTTTLMHHSASDVPYLTSEYWTKNASRLLVTTDYVYPRWLLFLTHNISVHTAHHVAPPIPFYNLPKAQEALKKAYPGMIRERVFSFRHLWRIIHNLHLYDTESGFYTDFAREAVATETQARGRPSGVVQAAP